MNTGNAMGYFAGAMTCGWFFAKVGLRKTFLGMTFLTILAMLYTGYVEDALIIFWLRFLLGFFCGYIFISGGVLATQLSSKHPNESGLILGIYYGGVGAGVLLSSLLVNPFEHWAFLQGFQHPWQYAWIGLALLSTILWIIMILPIMSMVEMQEVSIPSNEHIQAKDSIWIVSGYFLYGIGHVGYMTFVVALVRELGLQGQQINLFYGLLGVFVMASSRLWAAILDRAKGGEANGRVNLILAIACFIPTILAFMNNMGIPSQVIFYLVILSSILFGSSFIVSVASTTAYVKHNYPKNQWSIGIRFFTIIFATGQIIGPFLIGFIADHLGGLRMGLLVSSILLISASFLSYRQKSLVGKKSVG
jgi:MFS family permease